MAVKIMTHFCGCDHGYWTKEQRNKGGPHSCGYDHGYWTKEQRNKGGAVNKERSYMHSTTNMGAYYCDVVWPLSGGTHIQPDKLPLFLGSQPWGRQLGTILHA